MTDLFTKPPTEDTVDYDTWAKEKYGEDPQALKKALYHVNKHVSTIEKENAEAREEINKRITMEEMLAKIEASRTSPNTEHESQERESIPQSPNVSMEDIEKLVQERLSQSKQQDIAQSNISLCERELEKAWGSNYQEKAASALKELGADKDTMLALASKNPKLFLAAMLKHSPQPARGYEPPTSSFGSKPSGSGERNKKYYDKIRKEDPRAFWSVKVQDEYLQDYKRLGDAFDN